MPSVVRKKNVPMVPRSTHVAVPKPKVIKANEKAIPEKTLVQDKTRDNALALVSAAYASETPQPMELEEEYDPARPNEYDRYMNERSQRMRAERDEEMRRERDHDRDRDRDKDESVTKVCPASPKPPPPPSILVFIPRSHFSILYRQWNSI